MIKMEKYVIHIKRFTEFMFMQISFLLKQLPRLSLTKNIFLKMQSLTANAMAHDFRLQDVCMDLAFTDQLCRI